MSANADKEKAERAAVERALNTPKSPIDEAFAQMPEMLQKAKDIMKPLVPIFEVLGKAQNDPVKVAKICTFIIGVFGQEIGANPEKVKAIAKAAEGMFL